MSTQPRGRGAVGRSAAQRLLDGFFRAFYRVGIHGLRFWWLLTHPTLHGVYVAVWHDGRVLLIRNSYQRGFSFPSGRRGRRESARDAAVRELREEVGIAVSPDRLAFVEELTTRTFLVDDHVHLFELPLSAEPEVRIDHREVVWAGFEPPERARELPLFAAVAHYLRARSGPGLSSREAPRS